jgi:uncharacterized repeat protein (TIGR01451 family)
LAEGGIIPMKIAFFQVPSVIVINLKSLTIFLISALTVIIVIPPIPLIDWQLTVNAEIDFSTTETMVDQPIKAATNPTVVTINGRHILVNGKPFTIKGVGYAPTPIGKDPDSPPYGDYFTSGYSGIYSRDLSLLRGMRANTIRLWGWKYDADHTDFLDEAYNNGVSPIYVIVSLWLDPSRNISNLAVREAIIAEFRQMVAIHKNHPAVLMWAIGNELNASWMFGDREELFSLIDEMAQAAHAEEGANYHPVTTPLVDTDLIGTIANRDPEVPNLDVWSVQVYRGLSFGTLFTDYAAASNKPLVITEYGIDAYDDRNEDEYERIGPSYQAIYAEALWNEIMANSNVCSGGSIMAYSDEWWKGKYGQPDADHLNCPDYNSSFHSTCGYATGAHPDGYANEEWWGIMRTVDNKSGPDIMQPRAVYYTLRSLWTNPNVTKQADPSPVQDGAPLTYTIRVTNTDKVTLTATITDILPKHVTPTGVLNWTPTITGPGGIWEQQVVVTVETGYTGSLTNKILITTEEGPTGAASVTVCANYCIIYLPTIFKNFGS